MAVISCGRSPVSEANRDFVFWPGVAFSGTMDDEKLGGIHSPLPLHPLQELLEVDTLSLDLGPAQRRRFHCGAIKSFYGPMVFHEVTLWDPGVFRGAVQVLEGEAPTLLLFTSDEQQRCIAFGKKVAEPLFPGRFLLAVAYPQGTGGRYRLHTQGTPLVSESLGDFSITYYYVAKEEDHPEVPDTLVLDAACQPLALVPARFHDDLCIEGSGVLRDGRMLNYARYCTEDCLAASPCGKRGGKRGGKRRTKVCYQEISGRDYPYGMGAQGRSLFPDYSVAVDRNVIPLGRVLYLEELDGMIPPGEREPHSGCVEAVDVGGGIRGTHLDFFSGSRARWKAWERIVPTWSRFTVHQFHPRCME